MVKLKINVICYPHETALERGSNMLTDLFFSLSENVNMMQATVVATFSALAKVDFWAGIP